MASRQATYGVLVTTAFKKDTAGFWVENDILIIHPLRSNPKRTLVFGGSIQNQKQVILGCIYIIENTSKLPLYDIELQLQYPDKLSLG